MVWRCISVYSMDSWHVLEGTMNAESSMASSEKMGAELACSPDLSPIENIWLIIKQRIHQRQPQTLQLLETYTRQESDQIPTTKPQKIITLMPRRLQTVLKRRGDAPPW